MSSIKEQILSDYTEDIKKIEEWWASDRQKHVKRPYTAAKVASMRNSIPVPVPSTTQGNKLWKTLNKHREEATPIMTFGCVDNATASQMAKADYEIVYVSGGVCGMQIALENGRDHADYPSDTVPTVVNKLFKSQLYHDRRQKSYFLGLSEEEQKNFVAHDYLIPMVADGDMGFGGVTSIMKETKLFAEAGTGMVHYDDLAIGLKKFTEGVGRTVIPTCEYLKRLTAARLQLDIMESEMLLMSRIDCYHAEFINSVVDPRDHKWVRGATKPMEPFIQFINKVKADGKSVKDERKVWISEAKCLTYPEAVKEYASEEEYAGFMKKFTSKQFPSITEMKKYAEETVSTPIFFDWDLPRTTSGQYLFKACPENVIERAIAAMPLTDTTWARMDAPNWSDIVEIHTELRKVCPTRCFGFGFTAAFNYYNAGFTDETIKSFHSDLAGMGIVFQVQPTYTLQGPNMWNCEFAKMFKKEGMWGYLRDVQGPSLKGGHDHSGSPWGGAYFADELLNAADLMDYTIPL